MYVVSEPKKNSWPFLFSTVNWGTTLIEGFDIFKKGYIESKKNCKNKWYHFFSAQTVGMFGDRSDITLCIMVDLRGSAYLIYILTYVERHYKLRKIRKNLFFKFLVDKIKHNIFSKNPGYLVVIYKPWKTALSCLSFFIKFRYRNNYV